jgi:hypothetical protein
MINFLGGAAAGAVAVLLVESAIRGSLGQALTPGRLTLGFENAKRISCADARLHLPRSMRRRNIRAPSSRNRSCEGISVVGCRLLRALKWLDLKRNYR